MKKVQVNIKINMKFKRGKLEDEEYVKSVMKLQRMIKMKMTMKIREKQQMNECITIRIKIRRR